MDSYTAQTQQWLNDRFRKTTEDGVFYAHQNIYGFKSRLKSACCEDGVVVRYLIFSNVIKVLKTLEFNSLLDVGGAEGYMSAAIRELFGSRVRSCDLSEEACKRAREIFNVEADPVDGVNLPYSDGSFDVVLSSECLEHVPEYEKVLRELLRVARRAVIVTVPHSGPEEIARNIREKIAHGHIHDFTLDSFKDLVPDNYGVTAIGLHSTILRLPFRLVEGRPIDVQSRAGIKRPLIAVLNRLIPWCTSFMNEGAFKLLLKLDTFLAQRLRTYRQLVFVITKNSASLPPAKLSNADVDALLNFAVPPYVLQ